ncbi:hypothetical protein RN001_015170 [Aquatica leii]|uniref:Cap-specific mRNA (nucleoside-2'-O-)-methyltransferase 1 n=1 Tax=Aquatica leii TaxID=1421715 RepID=A0AAN7P300_9COLE|nr:hypothetical protein RN001_015170 [Aquatica leii]
MNFSSIYEQGSSNTITLKKKRMETKPKRQLNHVNLKQKIGCKLLTLSLYDSLWDGNQENISVRETIKWISSKDGSWFPKDLDSMKLFIVRGPPKLNIDDETNFCDPVILSKILQAKEIFEELDVKELSKARCRANAFETIRSAFFMNRAALKMANIDAVTGFIFTDIDRNPHHCKKQGPYYFADVCAGPGGFSEYILWRKKWMFKGFGFTLKCDHDFELYQSHCASPVSFNAQYGVHGDGNICRIDNIEHFSTNIRNECEGLGVHFMMSDGGFSVEGNENLQEILSKQLYVCQCLMALEIVRPNGHFVTKLFDLFTLFSVGLIFLMYKCFDKISILKPNASRPANSERYLLCYGLKNNPHTDTIRTYLASIATELWDLREVRKSSTIDINEIVPLSIIKSDDDFCEFLTESNNKIGRNQIIGLEKLGVFGRNARLVDPRQDDLRTESLRYWRIPDVPKLPLPKCTPDDLLKLAVNSFEFMNAPTNIIDNVEELNRLANTGDWLYALSGCTQKTNICNFYVGVGDSRVYRWQCSKWVRIKKLLLIRGTLLYGEMINEKVLKKVDDEVKEVTRRSLHVIDALRLGDTSLADLPLRERLELIETYCQAVNHESRIDHIRVRAKPMHQFLTIPALCSQLPLEIIPFDSILPTLGLQSITESYEVNSVMFLNGGTEISFQDTFTTRIQTFLSNNKDEPDAAGSVLTLTLNSSIDDYK